jgi:predicted small secreted protein
MEAAMRKLIAVLLGAAFLAGCNTMAGLGEDTQALGQSLERTAERNQSYRP